MPWKKGQRWVAQVRAADQRIQKVFPTKNQAQDWESQQRSISPENWKTHSVYSLMAMINDYLLYSKAKHSDKTFREKRDLFKRFLRHHDPNMDLRLFRNDDARLYLQQQYNDRSGYAANKDRKNLLAFFSWVGRYKGIINNCISSTEKFPEIRHGRYVPPEEDFWRTFQVAQGQDKTMLLTYLHTAARRKELFRLRWEDVDFGERKIRLFTRKRKDGTYEPDWLPLTEDLYFALIAHRDFIRSDWVFPNRSGGQYQYRIHAMANLCKKAKVRKFGFHAIRHLSATILAQNDVPMIQISQILRHKNLGTTERYLQRLGGLRESMEKAFKKIEKITS